MQVIQSTVQLREDQSDWLPRILDELSRTSGRNVTFADFAQEALDTMMDDFIAMLKIKDAG